MKRLTKRLAQLEAKLRYMASHKFSKSQMFGVIQKILIIEAAIAHLQQKTDLEKAIDLLLLENKMCAMCPAPDEYFEQVQPQIMALPRPLYKEALKAIRYAA